MASTGPELPPPAANPKGPQPAPKARDGAPDTVRLHAGDECKHLHDASLECSIKHQANKAKMCAKQFADYKRCRQEVTKRKRAASKKASGGWSLFG